MTSVLKKQKRKNLCGKSRDQNKLKDTELGKLAMMINLRSYKEYTTKTQIEHVLTIQIKRQIFKIFVGKVKAKN